MADEKIFQHIFLGYAIPLTLRTVLLRNSNTTEWIKMCANIWVGLVLAISGTEAWVKFKAPFLNLPKPNNFRILLMDVGTKVFSANNGIENAIALQILFSTFRLKNDLTKPKKDLALSLVLISFLQSLYITPKLNKLVKKRIFTVLTKSEPLKDTNEVYKLGMEVADLEARGQIPNRLWHLSYILFEAYKVVGLSVLGM